MAQRDLKVTLIGDDKTSGAFRSAAGNADGFNNKMSGIGKGIALAFGGAVVAGVAGFGAALFQGAKDAASYQQITDQLAQTIKSTGGAAGVSVEGLKAYAGQLESISGVDEELILSSQNVLATFTNIKNGVGAGNDVFNQASEAALNLSTTMGGDLQGASVLVGKALNDPIKGVTALSRAGVQLTQSQKDTIAAMVEAGDAAGAQKIILGELETQFGGAAAAAGQGLTGSIARLKDGFQDAFRTLAENLLPAITAFVTGAAAALPGIIERIKAGFDAARPALETVGAVLLTVGGFIRDNFMPVLAAVGTILTGSLLIALYGAGAALVALISPAVLVVAGIAALAAGLVVAYQQSETFRGVVAAVAAFLSGTVLPAFMSLVDFLRGQMVEVIGYVVKMWPQISAAVGAVMQEVQRVVQTVLAVVQALWNTFGSTLTAFVVSSFGNIKSVISGALDIIKGVFQTVLAVINGDWSRAWDGIKQIASGALQVLSGIVSQALNALKTVFSAAWDAIRGVVSAAWPAITGAVSAGLSALGGAVSSGLSTAVGFFTALPGRILGAIGDLGGLLVNAGRSIVDGLIRGITERFGALAQKASELAQKVKNFLPFSPAKEGPFSGKGNPYYSGRSIGSLLADGLADSQRTVGRAMGALTDVGDVAGMRVGGTGYINSRLGSTSVTAPAGGSRNLTVHIHADRENIDSDRLMVLLQRAERLAGV